MTVYEQVIQCHKCGGDHDGSPDGVDVTTHPTAQKLSARALEFLQEVKDFTPGKDLEARLNKDYGAGNPYYEDFCKYIKLGFEEGWIATHDLDSGIYRRGKIQLPLPDNLYMSLTCVYFNSHPVYAGQYHKHPYGEINCVIPVDDTFELEGMSTTPGGEFWQGKGWTSLGPGTHHYPRARGGKGFAFFFLPSGRIAYDASPGDPQPVVV